MRVAVLGATGFIGRHTVAELAGRGVEVIAVTRRSQRIPDGPGVRWVALSDYSELEMYGASAVIILAGANASAASVPFEESLSLARRVLALPFQRIVFASSATVYGDAKPYPRTEIEPLQPMSAYAQGKAAVERLLAEDRRCMVARIANVYGSGMSDINVLSDIRRQVGKPGPVEVRDASPVRDYLHVHDVARGMADLALKDAEPGAYNLSTGLGTSVAALAELICRLSGDTGRDLRGLAPAGRSSVLVLSPEKARRILDWAPAIALEDGLKNLQAGDGR